MPLDEKILSVFGLFKISACESDFGIFRLNDATS